MISTRDLSKLPDIEGLRRLLQSMAMLDAILMPEWDGRYYSFNSAWSKGQQMGSIRNGCGDDLFVVFSEAGCWIKGFAHESPMTPYKRKPHAIWPGILEQVPEAFAKHLEQPAFDMEAVTFCVWRRVTDSGWKVGGIDYPLDVADPDGSEFLLCDLDGRPESYRKWAADYYETEIDLKLVRHIYGHLPLTETIVEGLNPDSSLEALEEDVREIGYPAR